MNHTAREQFVIKLAERHLEAMKTIRDRRVHELCLAEADVVKARDELLAARGYQEDGKP